MRLDGALKRSSKVFPRTYLEGLAALRGGRLDVCRSLFLTPFLGPCPGAMFLLRGFLEDSL